jgi:hypothetical protein
MYQYNPCAPGIANNLRSVPYVKPVIGHASAPPESTRVTAETCTSTFVNRVPVTIAPSTSPPPVPVQTTSASATTAAAAQAVLLQLNNPYVPATRFSQYFPAPPLPYIMPYTMRSPNNYPKPTTRDCIPIRRFKSSAETLENS